MYIYPWLFRRGQILPGPTTLTINIMNLSTMIQLYMCVTTIILVQYWSEYKKADLPETKVYATKERKVSADENKPWHGEEWTPQTSGLGSRLIVVVRQESGWNSSNSRMVYKFVNFYSKAIYAVWMDSLWINNFIPIDLQLIFGANANIRLFNVAPFLKEDMVFCYQ